MSDRCSMFCNETDSCGCFVDEEITVPILKERAWELVKNDVVEKKFCSDGMTKIFSVEIKSDRFLVVLEKEIDAAPGWHEVTERLYCHDKNTGKEYYFRKKVGEDVYMDDFPEDGLLLEWTRQMREWAKEKSRQVK